MVLCFGVVMGVGYVWLIFECFGKFWGVFSVIDLFLFNVLIIVIEFIGIMFVLDFFGLLKVVGVCVVVVLMMVVVSIGDFWCFEWFVIGLCVLSFLFVLVFVLIYLFVV